MSYPLPLTRTEAYLAYKAGVVQQSDLKPSLAVPRNGIDAWLAYWTGLAADYPKREDGTPHILQEEEAYIAYLCGVINEYPEKCLRRVGAYLRYLISARWGRPDHPLNREELYLSLIKTQFIPSGDPSSDIVIDGTTKAPFVDVKMYGDTFQQTYTGKNLLAYPYRDTTKTVNDITFTDNGDGSVTVNGTLTGNEAIFWITRDIWSYNTANIVVPAGTYTISPTGDSHVYLYATAYGETQGLLGSWNATTTSKTFTISEKASLTIRISVKPQGATVNNLVVKPQLEAGSTATTFEPFVGGVPSPNPDYPQPIQTVTGEQTVTIEGKNKIKSSTTGSAAWSGTTVTYAGDQIIINKSGNGGIGANSYTNVIYTPLSANQAYTFSVSYKSGEINAGGSNIWDFYIYAVKADGSTSSSNRWAASPHLDTTNPSASVTFTPSEDFVGFKLGCYIPGSSSTTTGDVVFNAQLEKGSTATTYTPYSSTNYPISLGNIELCKLGTYQDYIWKDGEDWKIHKATEGVVIDSLNDGISYSISSALTNTTRVVISKCLAGQASYTSASEALCDKFGYLVMYNQDRIGFYLDIGNDESKNGVVFRALKTTIGTTEQTIESWLNSNPLIIRYVLSVATDTTITDTTLISQLEALVNGGAEEGTTYIKVNATDPNLPGLLYVEAPKYE